MAGDNLDRVMGLCVFILCIALGVMFAMLATSIQRQHEATKTEIVNDQP
jgi:hypothetical protein